MKLLAKKFCALIFIITPCISHAEKAFGPCQLQETQDIKKWPFKVIVDSQAPTLEVGKSATALMTMQAQYFSGKTSPFIKNDVPPELGFYMPNVTFAIEPFVTYSKTLDGRNCAKIVGVKLQIKQKPVAYLAQELAEKNCVSKAALTQQFLHHEATTSYLKEFAKQEAELKSEVFAAYETQGSAGKTPEDIARQLSVMEKVAIGGISSKFYKDVISVRREQVITREIFSKLYSSCDGEFEKASLLAKKKDEHKD